MVVSRIHARGHPVRTTVSSSSCTLTLLNSEFSGRVVGGALRSSVQRNSGPDLAPEINLHHGLVVADALNGASFFTVQQHDHRTFFSGHPGRWLGPGTADLLSLLQLVFLLSAMNLRSFTGGLHVGGLSVFQCLHMLTEPYFHFAQGFLLFVQACAGTGFSGSCRMRRCSSCSRFCRSACCCLNFFPAAAWEIPFLTRTPEQLFKAYMHSCSSANGRGLSWSVAVCFSGDLHRIAAAGLAPSLTGRWTQLASSYTMLALMIPGWFWHSSSGWHSVWWWPWIPSSRSVPLMLPGNGASHSGSVPVPNSSMSNRVLLFPFGWIAASSSTGCCN